MGFFSELKEDLSQAVNELMPVEEGAGGSAAAASTGAGDPADAGKPQNGGMAEETSLEDMLAAFTSLPEEDKTQAKPVEKGTGKAPEGAGKSPEKAPESAGETAEKMPEKAAESTTAKDGEKMPEKAADSASAKAEEKNAEKADDKAAEKTPENAVDKVAEKTPENAVDKAAEKTPENVVDKAAEKASEIVPETNNTEIAAQEDTSVGTGEKEEDNKESKGAEKKMDGYANGNKQALDETAVITAGMQIHGDIISEGSMDLIGLVEGNIEILGKLNITGHINGNSKAAEVYAEGAKINGEIVSEGAVKIGDSSVIIGNITAKSAAIAGAVKGDIDVQGPVVLDASAIVMGNIKSKSVQINNGAVIEGMCSQCYADVSPTTFFNDYKPDPKPSKKNKQQQ